MAQSEVKLRQISTSEEWEENQELFNEKVQQFKVYHLMIWRRYESTLQMAGFKHQAKDKVLALLQICFPDGVSFQLRLATCDELPEAIQDFLTDATMLKVAHSINRDMAFMANNKSIIMDGCVCSMKLAKFYGKIEEENLKSEKLCEIVLGRDQAALRQKKANWLAETLSREEIDYAADMAQVSMDVLMKLLLDDEVLDVTDQEKVDAFYNRVFDFCTQNEKKVVLKPQKIKKPKK